MEQIKKNIVIISHYFPPHTGGIEMVAYNHATKLAARGNTVTVITSSVSSSEKNYSVDGLQVIRIKAWNFFEKWGIPFPLFSPSLWVKLIQKIKKADVVHVHDAFYISSFYGVLAAKIYKKPIILTQHVALIAHSNTLVNFIQKVVYKTSGAFVFKNADTILTYNERVKQFLLSNRVNGNKLITLINGVDTEIFKPVSLQEKNKLREKLGFSLNDRILLFVGRYVPKKGFDKVLAIRDETYKIVCAGGDTPQETYEHVSFLGKLHPEKLKEVYQIADVFVLPSVSEGFPLSIQEAMASGLPIITVKDFGYDHYKLDSELFVCIEKSDAELLKETLLTLLQDENRIEAMGKYSRRYTEENFNWNVVIDQLESTYTKTIDAHFGKKEIAIVSDSAYIFNTGGKEKRLHDITLQLVQSGYTVTVYCMHWWKGKERSFVQNGIRYYAISPYYPLYSGERRSIKEAVFFSLHCIKLLFKKFDVIEVDHIPHLVLFTTKLVCLLKRKKMIVTWHEVWGEKYWKTYLGGLKGWLAYVIERITVTFPDIIVSVSDHTTSNLVNVLKARKPIFTIPIGFELDEIQKTSPSSIQSDIIFAGRLLENKNINVLLKALHKLSEKKIHLKTLIIGEGPEKESLLDLADTLGLKNAVTFLGFVEKHSDVHALMKSSKVFVLPSTREGFGMVVIEANACGLPVVTIDHVHNAAKDLIRSGNGALSILDEQELADTILTVLSNRKEQSFYTECTKKYNWSEIFPALQYVYSLK